jgi:hypothetical protein
MPYANTNIFALSSPEHPPGQQIACWITPSCVLPYVVAFSLMPEFASRWFVASKMLRLHRNNTAPDLNPPSQTTRYLTTFSGAQFNISEIWSETRTVFDCEHLPAPGSRSTVISVRWPGQLQLLVPSMGYLNSHQIHPFQRTSTLSYQQSFLSVFSI